MIKLYCDICGADCGLNAYDVYINVIHNPCPMHIGDTGRTAITDDNTHVRFLLCSQCYEQTKLPNPYAGDKPDKKENLHGA